MRRPITSPRWPTACSTPTKWAWSTATSSRPTASSIGTDGQAARPRPGQAHRGRSGLAHDGQRGKRPRHGRLPGPRASAQQPRGRQPLGYLQPRLHAVFLAHRPAAVSGGFDFRAAAEASDGQAGIDLQGSARCAAVARRYLRNHDVQEAGRAVSVGRRSGGAAQVVAGRSRPQARRRHDRTQRCRRNGSGVGSGVFTRFSLGLPTPSSGNGSSKSGSSRTISVSDRDTKRLDEKAARRDRRRNRSGAAR